MHYTPEVSSFVFLHLDGSPVLQTFPKELRDVTDLLAYNIITELI